MKFKKTFDAFKIQGLLPKTPIRNEIKQTDFANNMKAVLPRVSTKSVKVL